MDKFNPIIQLHQERDYIIIKIDFTYWDGAFYKSELLSPAAPRRPEGRQTKRCLTFSSCFSYAPSLPVPFTPNQTTDSHIGKLA
ncbi:MAG: hypothetical protein KAF91_28230 [Nostoc sp. TH1S01]|nr:hypothetical protein [Nostoc sp. TH1S01]